VRNPVATIPAPPNVEIVKNPIDEQLAQVLEIIPKREPESNDLSNLALAFLIAYAFIENTIDSRIVLVLVIMNPNIASPGM
jgi:hypothetical protein